MLRGQGLLFCSHLPPGGHWKYLESNYTLLLHPGWVPLGEPSPLSEPLFSPVKWGSWQCLPDKVVSCQAYGRCLQRRKSSRAGQVGPQGGNIFLAVLWLIQSRGLPETGRGRLSLLAELLWKGDMVAVRRERKGDSGSADPLRAGFSSRDNQAPCCRVGTLRPQ